MEGLFTEMWAEITKPVRDGEVSRHYQQREAITIPRDKGEESRVQGKGAKPLGDVTVEQTN